LELHQQVIINAAGLLTLFYILVIIYLRRGWMRIPIYGTRSRQLKTTVSVLIAARNEAHGISDTIEDILAQDYPGALIEVIVVDDHSTDGTAKVVAGYAGRGVRLIQLKEDKPLNSYKKKAIAEAIHHATGELMVTTDADCRMGAGWLSALVSMYEEKNVCFISGPVVYHEESNVFERMQTLEFLYLIGLGAATIGNERPATCNGANLAYKKDVFYEVGGFNGIDHLASGDDELLLHKVATRYPGKIAFCKSRDARVFTNAKPDLRSFISQRKRWASKSTRYKNKGVVLLGVGIWFFNAMILFGGIAGLLDILYLKMALVMVLVKLSAECLFLLPVSRFAERSGLMAYLPLLTVVHVLYMVFIGVAGNTGKYKWKGRLVN
jgi:cellulose synthase/poly-beta-1,6-N-acetylglucosamine synthase-like glycosyltransferase